MGYAKLFSSITESSLWSEPKEVRLLFVSMLARADANGFVEASVPGLARVANLTLAETESSLAVLEGPDPHSKDLAENPEHEGRRITKVPGGWVLLNYESYRNRPDDAARREYMRSYMADYRKRRKPSVNNGKLRLTQAEAEATTETNADKTKTLGRSTAPNDEEWFNSLCLESAYKDIDVLSERSKMIRWCEVNRKQPTRRRFINWLNRVDRPLNGRQPDLPAASTGPRTITGAERVTYNAELERVQKRMDVIKSQYEAHQAWSDGDRVEFNKLRDRRKDLRGLLGVVA